MAATCRGFVIRSVEFEGPYYEVWPPKSHSNIFVDFERKSDKQAWAQKIMRTFATRAYRRPVTAAEESSLMDVYAKAQTNGRSFQDSVKDALLVVLTSPQFLFLVETSAAPGPEPLDGYELASKLSYFLWNGPPDRKTLQLAANGLLAKQLDTEVDRMIADARFSRFVTEFASQWLSLDKFQVLEADRKRFPKLTRDTRTELKQEPVEFVQYLIRNNLPVKNLISSDFILANEAVANYYDLADKTESGFRFVAVPAQPARSRRRPHSAGDLGRTVRRPRIEPCQARRLAGAQNHRRTAGRPSAERACAEGRRERTHAAAAAGAAPQRARAACSATQRSTRGVWRSRNTMQAAGESSSRWTRDPRCPIRPWSPAWTI